MTDKYLPHFVKEMRNYCATMGEIASVLRQRQILPQEIKATAGDLQRLAHTIAGLSGSLEIEDFTWISAGLEVCSAGVAADAAGAQAAGISEALAGLLDLAALYLSRRLDALEAAGTFQTRTGQNEQQLRLLEETLWQLSNQFSQSEPSEELPAEDLTAEDQAILRAFAESDLGGPGQRSQADQAAQHVPHLAPAVLPEAPWEPAPQSALPARESVSGDVPSDGLLDGDIPEELVQLFRTETADDLQQFQSALARLERPKDWAGAVLELRRIAHKIKGAAATLELQLIADLAHCLEDILDLLMNHRLAYGRAVLDALVHGVFEMEGALRRGRDDPETTEGLERLRATYAQFLAEAQTDTEDPEATHPDSRRLALASRQHTPGESSIFDQLGSPPDTSQERGGDQTLRVEVRKLDHIMGLASDLATNRANTGHVRQEINEALGELRRSLTRLQGLAAQFDEEAIRQGLGLQPPAAGSAAVAMPGLAAFAERQTQPQLAALRGTPSHPLPQELSARHTGPLPGASSHPLNQEQYPAEHAARQGTPSHPLVATFPSLADLQARREALGLENLDSEQRHLVRVLNESVNDVATVSESLQLLMLRLAELADTQETLTGTIQRDITQLRLVPIRQILPRLQLTARMVAQEQNKQINFQTSGEATEIDRDIIEAITSPLAQLVRNCAAHGIESVEERRAQGKPDTGTIWLRAYYSGNEVSIEVGDDGSGINYQGLVAVALASGGITPEEAEAMQPEEAVNLMLLPNISTSPEITNIAGRGVGMDMVRTAVEGLKGTLHIHNRPGEGTTFHIRLPISLGVMRALFVRAGQQTYAVPLSAVERILERAAEDEQPTVPLFRLTELLGLAPRLSGNDEEEPSASTLYVTIGRRRVGVQIDQVLQEREIVVKRLPPHLRRRGVRGITFSPSSELLLLLDLPELVHRALGEVLSVLPSAGEAEATVTTTVDLAKPESPREAVTVLVVDDSQAMRRTLEFQLTRAGYRVLAAKDGVDALEIITQKQRPHLVLLDIEMPRMDGYEVLSILRSQRLYSALPIVMLTSRAADKHRHHAMELGADAYLVKPCPHDELLHTIGVLTHHVG